MEITQAQLMRAVYDLNKDRVDEFVASFNMYAVHFGLTTKQRIVHYLAQVFTESGALTATSENMNYSAQRLMQVWPSPASRPLPSLSSMHITLRNWQTMYMLTVWEMEVSSRATDGSIEGVGI